MEGGGEVRRINIVYFHCRNGKMDQPHLISVHRQNGHGVMLRDVKRWLIELRGECMAKSYAWSYKRRYRGGYVWQDLADGDLITAISDNEYVLKGSLLHAENREEQKFEEREEEEEEPKLAKDERISLHRSGSEDRGIDAGKKKTAKKTGAELIAGDNCGWTAANVMRTFIGCGTAETEGSVIGVGRRRE